MFSDSVEKRGLSAALALLPKDRRAAYKKYIDAHQRERGTPRCQSAVKFDPLSASNIGSDANSLHLWLRPRR